MHQTVQNFFNHFFIPFGQRVEGKEVAISPNVAVDLIPCSIVEARVFL